MEIPKFEEKNILTESPLLLKREISMKQNDVAETKERRERRKSNGGGFFSLFFFSFFFL